MHEKRRLVKVAAITGLALVMTTGIALASIGKGTVTADALRLRSQANTNSSIITLAPRNSVVTLLEELDGWYKVSYGDQVGYMSADWLNVSQTGSEAVEGKGTVTADALNVRSGAGTVYNRLGLLYKGTSVMILEDCGNGWYKVSGGGCTGYVSAEWVKVSDSNGSGSSTATPIGTGTVNTACLNVRSGAGTNYSRVGYLYNGNSVSILKDCGNGWYEISYGSGSAYVCADYISRGDSSNSGSNNGSSSETKTTGYVTADALNVRSGAGTNYSRLGLLYTGNSVTILGDEVNGWYKISYKNGVGYVSAEYISTSGNNGGSNNSGSSSTSSLGEKAVALAKQQLGKPYVYGAAGPNSFDCSGLFYYIFNQLGVNIARGSSSQYYNSGTFVSVDDMQPGDLVFLFDPKYDYSGGTLPTTHVLMYIGDNTVLHASTTSNTVRTDTLFGSYYGNYVVAVKRMG